MIPIQMIVALVAALVLDNLTSWLLEVLPADDLRALRDPRRHRRAHVGLPLQPALRPGSPRSSRCSAPTAPDFLAADTIFGSLVNIVTWQWAGYYMIIIYAALRGIDPSIYEAATHRRRQRLADRHCASRCR